MSLIKELKSNPENQLNLVEIIQSICPSEKTKYVDLLLKMLKKTPNIEEFAFEIKRSFKEDYNIDPENFKNFTPLQLVFIYRFIDASFDKEDIKSFSKFVEYNERGLIDENDLTKFNSFKDILNSTSMAEIKVMEKDLEKQIKILHSDSEWVVLRPLTYHSSLKYGSSTKWCTASNNNPEQFLRYTKRGILIYMINKITGKKVACFKALNGEPEFSFWNQIDTRIDSLEADLPNFIYEIIKYEIKFNSVTNFSMLNDEDKVKQEKIMKEKGKHYLSEEEPTMIMNERLEEEPIMVMDDNEFEWEDDEPTQETRTNTTGSISPVRTNTPF